MNTNTTELSPKENLSNGDEVTVTAVVDNDTAKEYDLALKGGEKKFTVEGLQEPQELDLFENIDVQFNGIAPYITASVNGGSVGVDVDYSIPEVSVDFWGEIQGEGFKSGDYYYAGYEDLDSLFNHCVTKNIEWYEYESGEAAN